MDSIGFFLATGIRLGSRNNSSIRQFVLLGISSDSNTWRLSGGQVSSKQVRHLEKESCSYIWISSLTYFFCFPFQGFRNSFMYISYIELSLAKCSKNKLRRGHVCAYSSRIGRSKWIGGIYLRVKLSFNRACLWCQGVTYPACHGIWRHWAPPLERSRLATISFTGSYAGAVLGLPLSGVMTEKISWESSFYFYGVVGVIWFVAWWFFSHERPATCPSISVEERIYIEESIGESSSLATKVRLARLFAHSLFN